MKTPPPGPSPLHAELVSRVLATYRKQCYKLDAVGGSALAAAAHELGHLSPYTTKSLDRLYNSPASKFSAGPALDIFWAHAGLPAIEVKPRRVVLHGPASLGQEKFNLTGVTTKAQLRLCLTELGHSAEEVLIFSTAGFTDEALVELTQYLSPGATVTCLFPRACYGFWVRLHGIDGPERFLSKVTSPLKICQIYSAETADFSHVIFGVDISS